MRKRLLLVSGALAATAAVGYAQFVSYDTADITKTANGKAFVQLFGALHQLYLKPLDDNKLMNGAIKGMIASLDDEFTYYVEAQANQTDQEDLTGEFFGIGIQLVASNADGTGAKVDTVFKTGSAVQGGVQAGDVFLKIGDKDVSTLPLNDVVRLVRGAKGTKVNITFGRGKSTYTVTLERQPVTIVSVEQTVLPNNVGYIALSTFYSDKVNEQFAAAVQNMKKKGITKLILDLRDNGGGLLSSGVFVADQFMQKGPIVSLRDGKGKTQVYDTAKNQPTDYTGQLVVLINKNSASASEIVAGALQDTKRATILGETSYGKGVAQTPVELVNGAQVRIVANEWLTPNGRQIQKIGITPDVKVEDNRRPLPLNFSGSGVKAGSKLTLDVGGKAVEVVADKDGKFTYTAPPADQPRSDVQGVAVVNPATDAELKAALQQFK
ncbi:S41 family peptidase [Deinococcus irradiatisoli]|uniref:S41 family peptidase n=1 Tax=Deinococcus irradiatisoli TaxID=2202254 RepID=A0A2Z3JFJ9_9DEIO|nr:S41 family peptidase [Deinococcus irradiatisoli]AWN23812.1 S41 family peptidase [Deinococcus irradiatisoli]